VAEAATQQAEAFASERVQGRIDGAEADERAPIRGHPDVRRMLLSMRAGVDAMRLLLYTTAVQADRAAHDPDPDARRAAADRADLLTPVAKAWPTDLGIEVTSLGIQVHGGMGYIEETGIAQYWRDARIGPIYEGTNGIQAIDLVVRKLPRSEGGPVERLLAEIESLDGRLAAAGPELAPTRDALAEAVAVLRATTRWMLDRVAGSRADVLAGATPYLDLFGTVLGGWLLARRAVDRRDHDLGPRTREAVAIANFFAVERLSRASGLGRPITAGAARLAWAG
jgi:hypothetical protein